MRQPIFSRGLLTDWLLDHLEDVLTASSTALLLGDGIAPEDGGWTGGQPGQGVFRPYVVVTPGTAGRNQQDPAGDSDSSWRVNYTMRAVGGSRQQVEWSGDKARAALSVLTKVQLDLDGAWTVQQARYETLGAPARNDSTDPPYWEAADGVALWLERT